MKKVSGWKESGKRGSPAKEPEPKISRKDARRMREREKPMPFARPSREESIQLFFEAKLSARARIMQFTAIRGINIPKFSARRG